jgi:hypothetical protein
VEVSAVLAVAMVAAVQLSSEAVQSGGVDSGCNQQKEKKREKEKRKEKSVWDLLGCHR